MESSDAGKIRINIVIFLICFLIFMMFTGLVKVSGLEPDLGSDLFLILNLIIGDDILKIINDANNKTFCFSLF